VRRPGIKPQLSRRVSPLSLWQRIVEKGQRAKADILTMALVHAVTGDEQWVGKM
jgi:hypothetical protein